MGIYGYERGLAQRTNDFGFVLNECGFVPEQLQVLLLGRVLIKVDRQTTSLTVPSICALAREKAPGECKRTVKRSGLAAPPKAPSFGRATQTLLHAILIVLIAACFGIGPSMSARAEFYQL